MSTQNSNNNKRYSRKGVKRWTDTDAAVIVDYLQQYPTNYNLAFREASKKLGRSISSVSQYYYKNLKNGDTIVAIGSNVGVVSNSKVTAFKDTSGIRKRKAMLTAMFKEVDPEQLIETFLELLTIDEQKSMFDRVVTKLSTEV